MNMLSGGGSSLPMFTGQVVSAKDQTQAIDSGVTQQLQSLGFSPDYIKNLLGSVQTARTQYENYLKDYLKSNPEMKGDMKDKGTDEEKYAMALAQYTAGTATQNMLVMQSVAMSALGLSMPMSAPAAPPATPKK